MKLFKITFTCYDYDQYDSFVVVAKKKEDVLPFLQMHYTSSFPCGDIDIKSGYTIEEINPKNYKEPTEIISSFNAG
jgi:hypothetical protein